MRRIVAGCVAAAWVFVMAPGAAYAAPTTTRIVDDDGVQCGSAAYRTIGAAVAAAHAGDTIRVCAGVYRERVDVTTPLHIVGQQGAVGQVPCIDPQWSSGDAVDPKKVPVVEPPDSETASLFRLRADGIEVAGLVFQGQISPDNDLNIYDPAIQADGARAGHWVHHNLIQRNTLGVELGSNGSALSRVDHNCLRGNAFDVATQRYTAINVRVDHNETYTTQLTPFEASTVANVTQGPISIKNARFDHNRSVEMGYYGFAAEGVESSQIDHNAVENSKQAGIYVLGGNTGLSISANQLSGYTSAVGVWATAPSPEVPAPSTGLSITENTVRHFNAGILVGFQAYTSGTQVLGNVTNDNTVFGIQVGQSNTKALVKGNTSNGNGYGIRTGAPPTVGNVFVNNSMHGNTTLDAQDNSYPGNTWTGNRCDTDSPAGALCVR